MAGKKCNKSFLPLLFVASLVLSTAIGSPVSTLIHGGYEASRGEFPWMVSIQAPNLSGNPVHICSGTLISPTKVVTAAHCTYYLPNYPWNTTRILAGAHILSNDEQWSRQIRSIDTNLITDHHMYDRYNSVSLYDISIIEIDPPFEKTDFVKWAQLPPSGVEASGWCKIAGWGYTEHEAKLSDVLLKADLPIVPKGECQQIYPDDFHYDSQICAGKPEGGVDFCFGDTGGAIICDYMGQPFFAGVASSGYWCGVPGKPGIYTETAHVIEWLFNPHHEIEYVIEDSVEEEDVFLDEELKNDEGVIEEEVSKEAVQPPPYHRPISKPVNCN